MTKIYNEWIWKESIGFMMIEPIFSNESKRGVITGVSAADLYGFSHVIPNKIDITYPKGYNPNKKKEHMNINYKTKDRYEYEMNLYLIDGIEYRIYSPERVIVEMIKNSKNNFNDMMISTIKEFFTNMEYDVNKIMEIARFFNIENQVKIAEAIYRHG